MALKIVPSGSAAPSRQSVVKTPYNLHPLFEGQLVLALCTRPAVFARIGMEVDPALLPSPSAQRLVKAAGEVARELGIAPTGEIAILQRLHLWMEEGKVSIEQIRESEDLLDATLAGPHLSDDSIVTEMIPLLRERLHQAAGIVAVKEVARGRLADMGKVIDLVHRGELVGSADPHMTRDFDPVRNLEEIRKAAGITRYSTGILELDVALNGGIPRGAIGIFAGSPGVGKSMALDHIAAHSMMNGLLVGIVSLELSWGDHLSRIVANLTNAAIDDVIAPDSPDRDRIEAVLSGLLPRLAPCAFKDLDLMNASVEDVKTWVKEVEQARGRQMDLLLIDPAKRIRRLLHRDKLHDDAAGERTEMVFNALRQFSQGGGVGAIWTTDHIKNKNARKHRQQDQDDTAGSSEKARSCDVLVFINQSTDDGSLDWSIEKNRNGPWPMRLGPIPHHKERGRVAPVQ